MEEIDLEERKASIATDAEEKVNKGNFELGFSLA